MNAALIIAAAVIGYLLGSISFAVIVSRRYGVDILKAGSGNPGATNVKRVVGKMPGNVVFALDFLKGFIAAGWPLLTGHLQILPAGVPVSWMGIAGLAGAILGHSFSIFLKFRGGKGVAATAGGLMALMPLVIIAAMLVWLIVFYTTRYVSLASIIMGIALMPLALIFQRPVEQIGLCLALGVLILVRHKSNLQKLADGTEHKFEKKPSSTAGH